MGGDGSPEESSRVDREQMEQLFTRFYPQLVSFFRKKGAKLERSRDLAQDVFLKACKGAERFRGEASHATWLFVIARSVWKNSLRDAKTHKRRGHEVSIDTAPQDDSAPRLPEADDPDPLDRLLDTERYERLSTAVDQLPARMRHCVVLRLVAGLRYAEIGRRLGVSTQTVKSQIHQAKKRLRAILGSDEPGLAALDERKLGRSDE